VSNETVFFILGISLVVVALVVSFGGLRFKNFPPSRGVLVVGVGLTAALVVATAVFAWRNGEDEKAARGDELAAEAAANEASGNTTEASEEEGPTTVTTTGTGSTTSTTSTASTTTTAGNPEEGGQLFNSQGCSGCHTLAAAGSSGTTGPNLDGALKGQTPDFIKTSIIDPNADVAEGYPPDVMPQNFEDVMSAEQIDSLVAYLVQSTSGK
jgi:mono/diheme cytochrome c family protein